jgi:phosphoribosylformimino-5-aminoimidazole carboxamide ribotide isomerase
VIATPAVDLRGGRCVQLVGGRPEDERVSLPDPVAVAAEWRRKGFRSLHVVDLDAALGHGDNRDVVRALARDTDVDLQAGGGVRDEQAVQDLLDAGARRVVVGTRAVDDRDWLGTVAARHPGRMMVAADVRDGWVLRKGWTEGTGIRLPDFLDRLADVPLGGILCTDVGREGRMEGIDGPAVAAALRASPHPMWVSGGVTTLDELEFLDEHDAAGVVLGMALYTGALDADAVARRYGAAPSPNGP